DGSSLGERIKLARRGHIMRILGIESSCDETAVALYDGDVDSGQGKLLAERIASQIATHARFGGVVPEVASREHLKVLPMLVNQVLDDAQSHWNDVDAIAVTAGPGLMGALLVGTSYARAAGLVNHIPVLPIHHMEGHLLAAGLSHELPDFPFITLLVSGGHTMLVRVDAVGKYRIIGQTLDDAAGECFDKSARVLGLPYPGGPEISRCAVGGDAKRFKLPRPMLQHDHLNFSFSGLKTAVMYAMRDVGEITPQIRQDMAASMEAAVGDVLVKKSLRACQQYGVPRLLMAGGVAANRYLRNLLEKEARQQGVSVTLPNADYCTDNAAMIAFAAFKRFQYDLVEGEAWDARPRWSLTDLKYNAA
ncbi:MAG: tRNA (adenosine(37)-N6)-threonylcarbamoyltransferase complex transferase subunit TsaD, partial [Mariprofundaceae bacterium]|nr:tRNA (adenosine(37)-N6)-threonylcarbamoyltransferase complex transferase subunit TsaD [Mariprofundaceae bacterium]